MKRSSRAPGGGSMVARLRASWPFARWRRTGILAAEDGVAAVEFALVAPVFITVLVGIVVYGIYFTTWIAVTQIAAEAARAGLAGLTGTEQASLATTRFNTGLASYAPMLVAANATLSFPTTTSGTFAVKVSYDFTKFGFSMISLLPVPTAKPSITVTVSTGSP